MNIIDFGIIEYKKALNLQIDLLHKRIAHEIPDTLIVLEHESVVTLGRIASKNDFIDRTFFEERNIPIISAARGGKITYHAPGQLVLYPIVDLAKKRKDIAFYIDFLEKTTAKALNRLDVPAVRIEGKRGVWVSGKKIAFTGIALKRWVTFHGISININNDIEPFLYMHPCGEMDIQVTSAKLALGKELDMNEVKRVFVQQFGEDLNGAGPQSAILSQEGRHFEGRPHKGKYGIKTSEVVKSL